MLVNVIEKIGSFKVKREAVEEVNTMKLKCNFCVIEKGNAVKSDNLYLRQWRGRDYLVCRKHKAIKIIDRRQYERTKENTY